MKIGKLGLVGLLMTFEACNNSSVVEKSTVDINPNVNPKVICTLNNHWVGQGTLPHTRALDNDGDGKFDEALVTKGYFMGESPLRVYLLDREIALATTHYVSSSLTKDKQLFAGFSDTRTMSPEYQIALNLACSGNIPQ